MMMMMMLDGGGGGYYDGRRRDAWVRHWMLTAIDPVDDNGG